MGHATSAQQSLEHATASRQSASPGTAGDGAQTSRAQVPTYFTALQYPKTITANNFKLGQLIEDDK